MHPGKIGSFGLIVRWPCIFSTVEQEEEPQCLRDKVKAKSLFKTIRGTGWRIRLADSTPSMIGTDRPVGRPCHDQWTTCGRPWHRQTPIPPGYRYPICIRVAGVRSDRTLGACQQARCFGISVGVVEEASASHNSQLPKLDSDDRGN